MLRFLAYLGQAVVYGLIALCLGAFASFPSFRYFPEDRAQLVLSFAHNGQHKGKCRKPTAEEIAETAANMRRAELCPRERHPIFVELRLSGETLYSASVPPTGLAGDGASQVYQRFEVAPGRHEFQVRLRETGMDEGFDFTREAEIALAPGQNFVVDFRSEMGGFFFPGINNDTGS